MIVLRNSSTDMYWLRAWSKFFPLNLKSNFRAVLGWRVALSWIESEQYSYMRSSTRLFASCTGTLQSVQSFTLGPPSTRVSHWAHPRHKSHTGPTLDSSESVNFPNIQLLFHSGHWCMYIVAPKEPLLCRAQQLGWENLFFLFHPTFEITLDTCNTLPENISSVVFATEGKNRIRSVFFHQYHSYIIM